MKPSAKNRFRVIINDDCVSHANFSPKLFELWRRTAVNTYSLCIGEDQLWYPAKVGDLFKDALIRARQKLSSERVAGEGSGLDWYNYLVRDKLDPLAVAIKGCRRHGLEVWASLRMNDIHHGADPDGPLASPYWHAHPELRAKGWDRRAWASYNFAFPQVRQRRLNTIRDVVGRYDVDGFDLDYATQPPFFDRGRGYRDRGHMTALVREARKILDAAGAKRGKRLKLVAACLASIQRSEEVGLDVRTWAREGLVDALIPTRVKQDGSYLPVEEFLALTRGTNVEVCPNIGRGACDRRAEALRATALTYHRLGAHGIQLFNYFWINAGEGGRKLYDTGIYSELADPARMERKDQHYFFLHGLPIPLTVGKLPPHDYYYWLDVPRGCRLPPPVPGRKKTGRGEFRFFIADDIEKARRARQLVEQRLVFNIVHATVRDRFAFSLNGRRIPRAAFTAKFMASDPLPADRPMPPYMKFEVDLAKLRDVRTGWNTLRVDVLGGDDTFRPSDMYRGLDLILFEAELILRYR